MKEWKGCPVCYHQGTLRALVECKDQEHQEITEHWIVLPLVERLRYGSIDRVKVRGT